MREFLKWVSITNRYCSGYLDKKLAAFDMNSSQHIYILKICEQPGITQDRLYQIFRINPSNITRALAQLEKNGLLTREPSKKDKRTCHLYPTPKAREYYKEIIAITAGCGEQVLRTFSEEEKRLFLSMLEKAALEAIRINEREKKEEPDHEANHTNT